MVCYTPSNDALGNVEVGLKWILNRYWMQLAHPVMSTMPDLYVKDTNSYCTIYLQGKQKYSML